MPGGVLFEVGLLQAIAIFSAFVAGGALTVLVLKRFRPDFLETEAERKLGRLKVMFEDAIAAIDDGFVLYDEEDRMYICNEPFRRQFGKARTILDKGLTYEEQVERLAASGIVPGIEGKEAEFVQSLMQKRHSEFGLTKVFQTHEGRWIRQRDKKTSAGNVVGLRTDVTELKERELELEEAQKQAEAAAKAKSAFLANMSHEIRTPMNGIMGMAELLEETDLDEEQRMCARTVVESSNALLSLVNDILDFSKAEAGKMTVTSAPFDVVDCIHGAATLLAPNAAEKKIEICLDIPENQHAWFLGDQGRLRQILINLLGNAVKFTETGFILIQLREKEADGGLEFRVRDTGIGIPEEKLGTIFDVFEQVNSGSTRRYDGAGLGLAISHKLITLMEGDIHVTSTEGEGSEFVFALPLPRCDAKREHREPLSDDFPEGLRVLVVDDLEVNRVILQKSLGSWGAEVTLASSGKEALSILREGRSFDLAILDFQMPEMDGSTLLTLMREIPHASQFPVVLLSSVDVGLDTQKVIGLGFAANLMKTMRAHQMKQTLLRILLEHNADKTGPQADVGKSEFDLGALRILVAEDNRTNQLVIRKMLEKHGATVEICENGKKAVESYFQRQPDIVLMDVSMPEMNGHEATRIIREFEASTGKPAVPILALTANATVQDREQCLQCGMNDFLSKPVRKGVVLQKIEENLKGRLTLVVGDVEDEEQLCSRAAKGA